MSVPNFKNRTIWVRDNLPIMRGMNSACVDLIYLDPPFNSNVIYRELPGKKDVLSSFIDAWKLRDEDIAWHESIKDAHRCIYEVIEASEYAYGKSMKAYLCVMTERLFEMHRILKETGSIYLHCDPTASHYLKIIMDCIFNKKNFLNEVIWYYKNASRGKKQWAKSHDVILWYSKSKEYTFNRDAVLQPFESGMTEWRYKKGGQKGKEIPKGKTPDDVITLPSINANDKTERTGYPTQKPIALLERVISASSNEGDIVFDPFCGCATAPVAAEKLGRQWVGIDVAYISGYLVRKRLVEEVFVGAPLVKEYEPVFRADIPKRTDIQDKKELDTLAIKQKKHADQEGKCAGCEYPLPLRYLQKDRIIPGAKGGQYTEENIQLLCQPCNSTKGDKDMTYLKAQLKKHDLIFKG